MLLWEWLTGQPKALTANASSSVSSDLDAQLLLAEALTAGSSLSLSSDADAFILDAEGLTTSGSTSLSSEAAAFIFDAESLLTAESLSLSSESNSLLQATDALSALGSESDSSEASAFILDAESLFAAESRSNSSDSSAKIDGIQWAAAASISISSDADAEFIRIPPVRQDWLASGKEPEDSVIFYSRAKRIKFECINEGSYSLSGNSKSVLLYLPSPPLPQYEESRIESVKPSDFIAEELEVLLAVLELEEVA